MAIRRALLVGINAYPHAPLRGCVSDVLQIQDMLKRYYGFSDDGIRSLVDGEATRAEITKGLEWLAHGGADADAVRVFHYSGHGTYVADENGDEPDGRDECLVPYDYESAGVLTDDGLKALYDRFPQAGNFTLVMDSCHSGSVQKAPGADVVFRFLPVSMAEQARIDAAAMRFADDQRQFVAGQLEALRGQALSEAAVRRIVQRLMMVFEKKRFGDVRVREANVLLAGCRPEQQAADAPIAGAHHGAFTYYLCRAVVQSDGQITYRRLAQEVARDLDRGGFLQIPQLEYRGERDGRLAFHSFT
jgi:hypothetical protein